MLGFLVDAKIFEYTIHKMKNTTPDSKKDADIGSFFIIDNNSLVSFVAPNRMKDKPLTYSSLKEYFLLSIFLRFF